MKWRLTGARFKFVWQDLWVGVFIKKMTSIGWAGAAPSYKQYTIYICFVPCVPLILNFKYGPQDEIK